MTVTSDEPRRSAMPRRPVAVSAKTCLRNDIDPPYRPASASTTWSLNPRHAGTAPPINASSSANRTPATRTTAGIVAMVNCCRAKGCSSCGDRKTHRRRRDAEHDRLREDQQHHLAIAEPHRLQHGELRPALADRLHHERTGREQQREEHRADHAGDDVVEIGCALELRGQQIRFRLRARFVGRIGKRIVDGERDGRPSLGSAIFTTKRSAVSRLIRRASFT